MIAVTALIMETEGNARIAGNNAGIPRHAIAYCSTMISWPAWFFLVACSWLGVRILGVFMVGRDGLPALSAFA